MARLDLPVAADAELWRTVYASPLCDPLPKAPPVVLTSTDLNDDWQFTNEIYCDLYQISRSQSRHTFNHELRVFSAPLLLGLHSLCHAAQKATMEQTDDLDQWVKVLKSCLKRFNKLTTNCDVVIEHLSHFENGGCGNACVNLAFGRALDTTNALKRAQRSNRQPLIGLQTNRIEEGGGWSYVLRLWQQLNRAVMSLPDEAIEPDKRKMCDKINRNIKEVQVEVDFCGTIRELTKRMGA